MKLVVKGCFRQRDRFDLELSQSLSQCVRCATWGFLTVFDLDIISRDEVLTLSARSTQYFLLLLTGVSGLILEAVIASLVLVLVQSDVTNFRIFSTLSGSCFTLCHQVALRHR